MSTNNTIIKNKFKEGKTKCTICKQAIKEYETRACSLEGDQPYEWFHKDCLKQE